MTKCQIFSYFQGDPVEHTLCLARSSLERAEDMILRRIEEGAEKWALRDLRREDETSRENRI